MHTRRWLPRQRNALLGGVVIAVVDTIVLILAVTGDALVRRRAVA